MFHFQLFKYFQVFWSVSFTQQDTNPSRLSPLSEGDRQDSTHKAVVSKELLRHMQGHGTRRASPSTSLRTSSARSQARTVLATPSFNTLKCQQHSQHPLSTLVSVIPVLPPSLTTNEAAASCLDLDHDFNMPASNPLSNSESTVRHQPVLLPSQGQCLYCLVQNTLKDFLSDTLAE